MPASVDRLLPVCELLLAAAYADDDFHADEKALIESRLLELLAVDELPPAVRVCIDTFESASFDVASACAEFSDDPAIEKKALLELIAAVHDADDVYDLSEDDYLRSVSTALGMGADALEGLALDYETEDLSKKLRALTAPPPPPPR